MSDLDIIFILSSCNIQLIRFPLEEPSNSFPFYTSALPLSTNGSWPVEGTGSLAIGVRLPSSGGRGSAGGTWGFPSGPLLSTTLSGRRLTAFALYLISKRAIKQEFNLSVQ